MLLKYPDLDWAWLVREAKINDLQNRLRFLVTVARQLAELRGETATVKKLAEQEQTLERSRLQREGVFRESLTDAERRWVIWIRVAIETISPKSDTDRERS